MKWIKIIKWYCLCYHYQIDSSSKGTVVRARGLLIDPRTLDLVPVMCCCVDLQLLDLADPQLRAQVPCMQGDPGDQVQVLSWTRSHLQGRGTLNRGHKGDEGTGHCPLPLTFLLDWNFRFLYEHFVTYEDDLPRRASLHLARVHTLPLCLYVLVVMSHLTWTTLPWHLTLSPITSCSCNWFMPLTTTRVYVVTWVTIVTICPEKQISIYWQLTRKFH